jgi:hypothetical protein
MNLRYRDWRVIARFRGLPGLKSPRELRQALLLQMTPTELKTYHRQHLRLISTMLALAVVFALLMPLSSGLLFVWFLVLALYRLRYWSIDPITLATREFNRCLEAVVEQECKTIRQQRIDAGL